MKNASTLSRRRKQGIYPVDFPQFDSDEPRLPSVVDLRSVVFYRDLHRFISRYWKPHVKAADYSVLDMIFDRTIGWGKLWEWISLNQFVHGIWNEKRVYSDGTGLAKRTVQRALDTLLKNELILRKGKRGSAAQYALNFFWEPPQMNYLDGKTRFRPMGAESYWEKVASGDSMQIVTLIRRAGQEFYERDLIDGTE